MILCILAAHLRRRRPTQPLRLPHSKARHARAFCFLTQPAVVNTGSHRRGDKLGAGLLNATAAGEWHD
jgi:hypothetical protein